MVKTFQLIPKSWTGKSPTSLFNFLYNSSELLAAKSNPYHTQTTLTSWQKILTHQELIHDSNE